MKKKLLTTLAIFTISLTSVFSSSASAAGDGAWSLVGAFDVTVSSKSNVLMSTGGDIQITMWNSFADNQRRYVEVWEEDGVSDDFIKRILLVPGVPVKVSGISVDGTNRKAEIYLIPDGSAGQHTVQASMYD